MQTALDLTCFAQGRPSERFAMSGVGSAGDYGNDVPRPRRSAARLAANRARGHFAVMSQRPLRDEILQLPPAERLRLVEEIWESLAQSPDVVPVPDWHRELLDDRLADPAEQGTRTWEQVQENARRRQR
jgi:putative addiction module component (TIGR02574 family)